MQLTCGDIGIPTFRGAGGLWRSVVATSLATPEAFEENPSLVWQFYHYRREAYVMKLLVYFEDVHLFICF